MWSVAARAERRNLPCGGTQMKIAVIIARVLLGLVFTIFGLNGFLNFIPAPPPPPGLPGQFITVFLQSHWVWFVSGVQVIGGVLLLTGLYLPLGIALLGPVIYNILVYHLLLDHTGGSVAIVVALLWAFLFWRYRKYFEGLFVMKAV
jgi:putative oxidoreductase